jgi:PmbA protein
VDCEGSLGSDTILVENGVLKHLMNNLTSAEAMQEAPTGNAGRKALLSGNIHTDILVTPKNFRMDPGSDTLETLFEKMQNGVYLYDSLDVFHSIHIASGDYSIPCEGILIRDGKMAGKLPGLTINGKIQDLLKDITAVGNDPATYCMPILNSYLVSSPSVLVSKISVSR